MPSSRWIQAKAFGDDVREKKVDTGKRKRWIFNNVHKDDDMEL